MKLLFLSIVVLGMGNVHKVYAQDYGRVMRQHERTMQRYNEGVSRAMQKGWEAGSRYRSNSSPMPQYSSPGFSQPGYYSPSIQGWSGGQDFYGGYYPYESATAGGVIISGGNTSASGTTSSKGRQVLPLSPNVISINGYPVPKGATGYYYEGGLVKFVVKEKPAELKRPEDLKKLEDLPSFEGDPSAAHYAFTLLTGEKRSDEIGPLSLEEPIEEIPVLSAERRAEVEKNRFNMVKALFDNGVKPTIEELSRLKYVKGETVYRGRPDVLYDVVLVIKPKNNDLQVSIVYENQDQIKLVEQQFINGSPEGIGILRETPPSEHPFNPEALFFSYGIFDEANIPYGSRVRKYESPSTKAIWWLVESYFVESPQRSGAVWIHYGYSAPPMTPVAYRFFNQPIGESIDQEPNE